MSETLHPLDWDGLLASKVDDIDSEMLDIFVEEAEERFAEIDTCIAALSVKHNDKKQTNTLKRIVHTLKGSANTTGARKIGAIFHHLEDLLEQNQTISAPLLEIVQTGVDLAHTAFVAAKKGDTLVAPQYRPDVAPPSSTHHSAPSSTSFSTVETSTSLVSSTSYEGGESVAASSQHSSHASHSSRTINDIRESKRTKKTTEPEKDLLRVSTRTLDAMSKVVAEVNMNRAHVAQQALMTKSHFAGVSAAMLRLSSLLHEVELEAEKQMFTGTNISSANGGFDALQMDKFSRLQELTRRVAEAQNDILAQQASAASAMREITDAVAGQAALLETLTTRLNRVRQVPVSSIMQVMRRVVRAACRDTGKRGDIFFDADVEIDRSILEKAGAALEHILRNAIAHGIEEPAVRMTKGKDPNGTIEFRAFHDGGDVVIEVRDDGAGIDPDKVLRRAISRGLVKDGAQLSEAEIFELLFEPGFSTAESVTDIAGRGVGLDVVRSDIASMGGRVKIASTAGKGTAFSLRLPSTLTMITGVPVSWLANQYVIPVPFIDTITRVPREDVKRAYSQRKITCKNEDGIAVEYDFVGLGELVGAPHQHITGKRETLLLMHGERVAVHVEKASPAAEFTFRSMGPQISPASGVIGSTISVNGTPSLVIDVARIAWIYRSSIASNTGLIPRNERLEASPQPKEPLILVVDDSVTVREVTSRLLKRNGYRIATAEHGKEALEKLRTEKAHAIILDLEMPVMDGYETLRALRANASLQSIPVIMITSRVGDKHREVAFELGVVAYLGKPYIEKELLEQIALAGQPNSTVMI